MPVRTYRNIVPYIMHCYTKWRLIKYMWLYDKWTWVEMMATMSVDWIVEPMMWWRPQHYSYPNSRSTLLRQMGSATFYTHLISMLLSLYLFYFFDSSFVHHCQPLFFLVAALSCFLLPHEIQIVSFQSQTFRTINCSLSAHFLPFSSTSAKRIRTRVCAKQPKKKKLWFNLDVVEGEEGEKN